MRKITPIFLILFSTFLLLSLSAGADITIIVNPKPKKQHQCHDDHSRRSSYVSWRIYDDIRRRHEERMADQERREADALEKRQIEREWKVKKKLIEQEEKLKEEQAKKLAAERKLKELELETKVAEVKRKEEARRHAKAQLKKDRKLEKNRQLNAHRMSINEEQAKLLIIEERKIISYVKKLKAIYKKAGRKRHGWSVEVEEYIDKTYAKYLTAKKSKKRIQKTYFPAEYYNSAVTTL